MKRKYIFYLLCQSMIFTFISSCKKFVEINPPKDQLITAEVFSDSTNANGAILGIYVDMMKAFSLGFCSGGMTLYPGLSSDELNPTSSNINIFEFHNNTISTNNSLNRSLWTSAYKLIYSANACIEGIELSNGISPQTKNNMIGEIKCIRGFLYFNLVNLYGSVPVITTTNYNKNRLIARSPEDSVYDQIIADLKSAQDNLSNTSVTAERANYYAATALLSKVYLYRNNYPLAQTESSKIIDSGVYSLMPDLNTVFLSTSSETIWELLPVYPGMATWEGYYFVPSFSTSEPRYVITNDLLNSFENGDLRKTKWINVNVISGQEFPYPYKYKDGNNSSSISNENYIVFRLAEQYLIRAEAEANLDDLSSAISDINVIRKRAGLPDTDAFDKESVLSAIEKERRAELFCEWGNRWFDLKRTGQVNNVLSKTKSNWKPFAALYPIPLPEINANPNLSQNEGY
jgi:hypothetical protein